jgi:hypothetical protein
MLKKIEFDNLFCFIFYKINTMLKKSSELILAFTEKKNNFITCEKMKIKELNIFPSTFHEAHLLKFACICFHFPF